MDSTQIDNIEATLNGVSATVGSISAKLGDSSDIADGLNAIAQKLDGLTKSNTSVFGKLFGKKGGDSEDEAVKQLKEIIRSINSTNDSLGYISSDTNWIRSYEDEIKGNVQQINQTLLTLGLANLSNDIASAFKTAISDLNSSNQADTGDTSSSSGFLGNTILGKQSFEKDFQQLVNDVHAISENAGGRIDTGDAFLDSQIKNRRKSEENDKAYERYIRELAKKKDLTKDEKRQIKQYRDEKDRERKRVDQKKDNNILSGIGDLIKGGLGSFLSTEKVTASKTADVAIGAVTKMIPGVYGQVAGGIMNLLKAAFEMGAGRDRMASEYARTVGGGQVGKQNAGMLYSRYVSGLNRESIAEPVADFKELFSAMTQTAEAIGRATDHLSTAELQSAVMLKRFGIEGQALSNFDTFGKSIGETDQFLTRLYSDVSKRGLSFKNVSKAVNDNLKMAQMHTFREGLEGLTRMAEKSVQLKFNMQQVGAVADKLSGFEDVMTASANLSVLGGPFAMLSDPMELMRESLSDTEQLAETLIGMFGGNAFWNQRTQQFDMDAVTRQQMKAASSALGMSYEDAMNIAFNQARINKVDKQLNTGLDETTADYIRNIAKINREGNAYVTLNGQDINVSDLNNSHARQLQKESEAKAAYDNANLKDIWASTTNIGEKLDQMLQYWQEKLGNWVYKIMLKFTGDPEYKAMEALSKIKDAKDRQMAESYYNAHKYDDEHKGDVVSFARAIAANKYWGEIQAENGNIGRRMAEGDRGQGVRSTDNLSKLVPGGNSIQVNGPSHNEGGVQAYRNGLPIVLEGNERIFPKAQAAFYQEKMDRMSNFTEPRNDMSKFYNPMKVASTQAVQSPIQMQPVGGTIKLDMPTTITLNLQGYGKVSDIDVQKFIMPHVDKIMKEYFQRSTYGGYNKEDFYGRNSV